MIEIIPCRLTHLRTVAREMRVEDRAMLAALDLEPLHILLGSWHETPGPLAAMIDGKTCAVWGDCGSLLAPVGMAWLFATPPVETVPVTFFRFAQEWIARRLQARTTLRSLVMASHEKALRFYGMLGFSIGPALPQPPYGRPFCEIQIGRESAGPIRYFDLNTTTPTVAVSGRA